MAPIIHGMRSRRQFCEPPLQKPALGFLPSPGRITHRYDDLPFSRRFVAERDARRIKSDPAFIAMREEVLAIVHGREAAHA